MAIRLGIAPLGRDRPRARALGRGALAKAGLGASLLLALSSAPTEATARPTDMPATSLVAPGVWDHGSPFPITSPPPVGSANWFTAVRVVDFESAGPPGAHVAVTLRYPSAVEMSIDALDGFGLFLGDRDQPNGGTLAVRFDYGAYPQRLHIDAGTGGVIGGVLLPATLFSDATEPAPAAIVVNDFIEANTAGHVLIPNLTLGPTHVASTGIIISATNVVIDLHPDEDSPSSPDGSFQGVKLGEVTLSWPDRLGSAEVVGQDFSIDAQGLDGVLCAQGLDGVATIDVGGVTVSLSSFCLRFEDNVPSFESVDGVIRLPAEYFGCADGSVVEVPVTANEAGIITGALNVGTLSADCRHVDFGGVGELELAARNVDVVRCDGLSDGTTETASVILLTVDTNDGSFTLAGYSSFGGLGGTMAPLGLLEPNPANLKPKVFGEGPSAISQPGILLPATLTFGPSGVCIGCLVGDSGAGATGSGMHMPPMTLANTEATICVENLVLDLDTERRGWTEGQEPTGVTGGDGWRGLYAQEIVATLPNGMGATTITAERLGVSDQGVWASLTLNEPLRLALAALNGFGIALGDPVGPGAGATLNLQWDRSAGEFELYADGGVIGAILLPNGPFHPAGQPLLAGGADAPLEAYAQLLIAGTEEHPVLADGDGNWIVEVSTSEAIEVAASGVTLVAEMVTFDFHAGVSPELDCATVAPAIPCPLPDAFQGVTIRTLAVTTPEEWGGATLSATDFVIDADGVTGHVEADFAPGLELDVGAAGVSVSSVCVDLLGHPDGQEVALCGLGGTMALPLDYFGCQDGTDPDATLPVNLSYTSNHGDGVFTGSVDLADLQACKDVSFGGNTLRLGGGQVATLSCDGVVGAATTASFLTVEMASAPYAVTVAGWDGDPSAGTAAPAPIGALQPDFGLEGELLVPRDADANALIMPAAVEIGGDGVCVGCSPPGAGGFALPPMSIGDTGVFICADDVVIDAHTQMNPWSGDPAAPAVLASEGAGWMGLYARTLWVELPFTTTDGSPLRLQASRLAAGNRGVTGELSAANLPDIRFGGDFVVTDLSVAMTLVHNTPTAITVGGTMEVGFLGALPVRFLLNGGDWRVELGTGADPLAVTMGADGFELKMTLERLAFGHDDDDESHFVSMDAGLELKTPLFGTGQVKLQDFKITDRGEVKVDGGWYTFDQPRVMTLGGFSYELNRLGFGRDDAGRSSLTLGGAFQLQDVLPVQAEVHDMVVSWADGFVAPRLEVSGIDLRMQVPGVLTLDGGLRWCRDGLPGCANEGPGGAAGGSKWFEGDVMVALNSPPMTVGGKLMVGKNAAEDWSFWFVRLDAQLPAGIAIPATGVSLFGLSGGFGKNVGLNFASEEFPRLLSRDNPVTPQRKSLVFHAGTTVGSTHDNGFTLNADVDFLIQIPGPVIVFDGQAWLATQRNKRDLPPLLHVTAVFDAIAKYFSFALDVRYKINRDNGHILDLGGRAEVLMGEDDWHVYVGTRDRPISATLLSFINAKAFMMMGTEVPFGTGARSGFLTGGEIKVDFKAGVSKLIGVEAGLGLGGEMGVQMQPKQARVAFELGGYLRAFLWKFKAGFSLDASVEGQVAKPFKLHAKVGLKIWLPWPLPDPRFTVNFTWEKANQGRHRFPSPLKEVVFESETTGQTVTAYDVALDEYDEYPDAGATLRQLCAGPEIEVPFDSVTKVTFARPIDCRATGGLANDVRRCDGSPPGDPLPNAEHSGDAYFTDAVGDCQVQHRFTEWTVGGMAPVDLTGGWGGALGDDETVGATEARRWETFSFRPVKLTDDALCPPPSGVTSAAEPDACAPLTTIPTRCRVLEGVDSCWEAGPLAQAGFDGRFHAGDRLYAQSDDLLHPAGRCNLTEAAGVGVCGLVDATEAYAACCLPSGACHETTTARCEAAGGVPARDEQCDDPAVECVAEEVVGACCLPDGTCRELYASECGDEGGGFNAGATCDTACLPTGACCMRSGACAVMSFGACFTDHEGVFWNQDQACVQGCLEPQELGACCLPDGSCQAWINGADCTALSGYFTAGEERCEVACPPRGACCAADGCFQGTSLECVTQGGDGHWSVGQRCSDACMGSCCTDDGCAVSSESDCEGSWRLGGECGAGACAQGACCTPTGCVAVSDVQCEALAGTFTHGASCDEVGVCVGTADGTPCCCERSLWPVVCEETAGAVLFADYLAGASGALYAIDHPGDGPVGRCDPIPGAPPSTACPADDPATCAAFAASPPVACYLNDGTPLVPAAEEMQTVVDPLCDPPPPGPAAAYCPNQSYRVTLRTRSDVVGGPGAADCLLAPEGVCEINFRIAPPPVDLAPYVRWTTPRPAARPVYRSEDVSVQFTTDVLCELYSCCDGVGALDLELHSAGQAETALVAGTLRSAGCPADVVPALPRFGQTGDLLVFDPEQDLRPEQRYVMTIPGAPGQPPLYQAAFVTSRFRTFTEALAGARAYVDGDTVFVETAEALDWRYVAAHLVSSPGVSLDRWRVSPDDGTVHVWELDAGSGPEAGEVLWLSYYSEPNGRCGCTVDADCPGGGSCVDGRCEGGYVCRASADCGSMACFRDGPVVRRGGLGVTELVPLTLQTGGE